MKQIASTYFVTSSLLAFCFAGSRAGIAPVGLENKSSICYLNAVLQCLTRSASAQRLAQQPTNPFKQNTPAHAFYEFIHAPTKPGTLKSSHAVAEQVKVHLARYQDPRGQQDACDAFRILTASMHDDLISPQIAGQPQFNSFDFHQAAQIAGTRHTGPDRTSYIGPITPQKNSTLTARLQAYFAPQQTDTVTKQDYFRSTPTTLCIYVPRLIRTSYKPIRDVLNTDPVAFPEYLDLLAISFSIPPETERSLYQLIGSVEFQGGTNGGHYVAHVKYDQTWYLCNDGSISVEQPNFSNPGATLLFYELIPQNVPSIQKTKVKKAIPPVVAPLHAEAPSRTASWWTRFKRVIKQPRTWLGVGGFVLLALIIGDRTGTF